MKSIHTLIVLFFACCTQVIGQIASSTASTGVFDPAHDPVALKTDTTIQLLVSEYVLSKSVKASMGRGCQVTKTYKNRASNGSEYLIFEGSYLAEARQPFTLGVLLVPDAQGRFYFAAPQSIECSTPGCNLCGIKDGKCVGCCSVPPANGLSATPPVPLLKVLTTVDE